MWRCSWTYDCEIVDHCNYNYMPLFRAFSDIQRAEDFHTYPVFVGIAGVTQSEFRKEVTSRKIRIMWLLGGERSSTIYSFSNFDTLLSCEE